VGTRVMRLFVRAIRASAVTMLLGNRQGLAQRRRGAAMDGLSVTVIESPSGTHSSLSLSPSAPLLEVSTAWIRLRRGGGSGLF